MKPCFLCANCIWTWISEITDSCYVKIQHLWQISPVVDLVKQTWGLIKQYAKILPYGERGRREERSNNIVTYCVMLFDRSSWSLKHSSTNTTYIHLAREYWVSSRSYEMHHLANMWKQHKQKDETFITMNPHKWKYYHSHTLWKHIQRVCILNVHRQSHVRESCSYLCHFVSSKHFCPSLRAFLLCIVK